MDTPTIGRKSVWRLSDGAEGTVEELCLEQYAREGWKGCVVLCISAKRPRLTTFSSRFHSENGVLTMIVRLLIRSLFPFVH